MGYFACDPTSDDKCFPRCPDDDKNHCAACELFGCTGHQRKFALRVIDKSIQRPVQGNIKINSTYILDFLPLRTVDPVEWFLLDRLIRLVCDNGSFGAKNTLKPSDHGHNHQSHHLDYGLFSWEKSDDVQDVAIDDVNKYFNEYTKNNNDAEWPNLNYFWSLPGIKLDRGKYNSILAFGSFKEKFTKRNGQEGTKPGYKALPGFTGKDQPQSWLRGFELAKRVILKNGERKTIWEIFNNDWKSKKIFSFHTAGAQRTWGYTKANDAHWNEVTTLLKTNAFPDKDIKIGHLSTTVSDLLGFNMPIK